MTLDNLVQNSTQSKILILGFGTENRQFLEWLLKVVKIDPERFLIADKKEIADVEILNKYKIETFFGDNYLESLKIPEIEFVFKAPGIWSLLPELIDFREKKGKDRVNSSLVFFIQKFREQIIGITGTKGKSTTSNLITHLINNLEVENSFDESKKETISNEQNLKAVYCGNTSGISPYQFWLEKDQEVDSKSYFVIELSSFQLEDLGFAKVSPKYSVITNYYIDHLDQHKTKEEYWSAKDNIFKFNKDGLLVTTEETVQVSVQLLNHQNKIFLKKDLIENLTQAIESPLLGFHNQSNLTLAIIIVESILSNSDRLDFLYPKILENLEKYSLALANFKPLSHRLELVHSLNSKISINNKVTELTINFYDDGYATEPDAVVAAIRSLTNKPNEFLWLQVAGKDKLSNMDAVVNAIRELKDKVFRLDLCGAVGQRLFFEWKKRKQKIENFHETMNELSNYFNQDFNLDFVNFLADFEFLSTKILLNVVFSPGGSSFDEFNNQTERANWWVEKVKSIKLD